MVKKQNWILIIAIIIGIYLFSKGGVFTGAMVCTSNEPSSIYDIDLTQLKTDGGYSICQSPSGTPFFINCFVSGQSDSGIIINTLPVDVDNKTYTSCLDLITNADPGISGAVFLREYRGVDIYKVDSSTEMVCSDSDNFWVVSQSSSGINNYIDIYHTCQEEPTCGDGICSGESCSTCSTDCGSCPTNGNGKEWYESPIIWILIFIAFLLFRG